MNIQMPTPEEKNRAFQQILRKSYPKTWVSTLNHTLKVVGFRNLWVGLEWCALLPTLFTLIYISSVLPNYIKKLEETPVEAFFIAPFFYGSLLSLTLWKEYQDKVYTLKQVCVFSTVRLNSLRCLLLGGISILMQCFSLLLIVLYGGMVQISSLLLSLSLLLFYGGMTFYTLRKTTTPIAHSITFGVWILGCFVADKLFRLENTFDSVLSRFSIGAMLFFMVPTALFLGTQLKKYILQGEYSCYPSKM